MTEQTRSSPASPISESESWEQSRAGAWAARGFHYQHLVSALLLVRQWAGLAPPGYLVPEGLEDCVVELTDRRVWLQIKSRDDGPFRDAEVRRILHAVDAKAGKLPGASDIQCAVIIERPRTNTVEASIDRVLSEDGGQVFVCPAPYTETVQLLMSRLQVADVIAEGLANDLYRLVADASAQNASLAFEERRRITTTEVDRRIFERLEAEDHTAIDHAQLSGALEPVDLSTPVHESDFYLGVKVKPGHVAANLAFDRPNDVRGVLDALQKRRHVLVSGPSGAGKSALVWLATAAATQKMRWYSITSMATAADAEAIVRFLRSRRPSETSPIGVVHDEVGSANSDLWDVLVRELRGLPELYFLGSVRQEDVNLIANQSDTVFIPIALDDTLAQSVWQELFDRNLTSWCHWREPFEQSEGLMLEYVHILTQGQRLATVIADQMRLREQEGRDDELNIVRGAAVLCARGGEVDADKLFEQLDLAPHAANLALRRLIDEHLVRESRPGILGGLHSLRSNALVEASHDGTVFRAVDTLWRSLPAATNESLPKVVRSILDVSETLDESQILRRLADILSGSREIDQWAAILTGLGLATLERHVATFLSMLDQHRVLPAHRSLASAYADPLLDVPDFARSVRWRRLQDAVLAFRALPKRDLRAACVQNLRAGTATPHSVDTTQTNSLLSSLAPICGGDSVEIPLRHDLLVGRDHDVRQIARLLSTAYLLDPTLADRLVQSLGGEQALLDLFHSQVAWTTPPTIEAQGRHGRTVRTNWHHIAAQHQPDPHEAVCEICKTLMALSPGSDAAACNAVDPSGASIVVGDFSPWSKNMPRANLPPDTRVAWNTAFRGVLLARTTVDRLTDYTSQMAALVCRAEKVFRTRSEAWIKGKHAPNPDALASEINAVVETASVLAYSAPEKAPSTMTERSSAGTDDKLGALLVGVLGNLVGRLSGLDTAKAAATFAGSLYNQAREHCQSEIWRTTSSPPLKELTKLADRLHDVSCILHEIAHDTGPDAIQGLVRTTRGAGRGNAVRAAARHCRMRTGRRFQSRLRALEKELAARGYSARCLSRPITEPDSPYWPAREVAVSVEIEAIETHWLPNLEELLSLATEHLDNDWPFRIVPVMNGQILPSLAILATSHMPLPDQDFARNWADFTDRPMHSSFFMEKFEEAADACMQISAIANSRGLENLHPDENEILSRTVEAFNAGRDTVENAANQAETEHFALALDYLDRSRARLGDEIEAVRTGQPVEESLCMTPYLALAGQQSEQVVDIAAIRLELLQAECARLADNQDAANIDGAIDNNG